MIFAIPQGYYLMVTYILAGLIGLCVGSFLNVVIYRVPEHMSLAKPASHCPQCGYVLKWYDNIPILSYCMLGGKCRSCREHISLRYTVVEAANMLLWLLCVRLFYQNVILMGAAMLICSVCLCVCCIDLEKMIIPDRFQVLLAAAGVAVTLTDQRWNWLSHVIGAVAGGVVFYLVAWLVSSRLEREAMGGGDIKLAAAAGLILGWQRLLLMVLLASVSGSIVMLIRQKRTGESVETPFGPFLTGALLVALMAGNLLVDAYISLLLP
ncbi:MAG: prepilin peptidase [Clostridia bacterium]|nr:prepilin peptidase [Clostridia bacterium]